MIKKILGGESRLQLDLGLLILRVGMGLAMAINHGFDKLFGDKAEAVIGFMTMKGIPAPGFLFWLVALTEGLAALFIALGFLTRLSALALVVNMLVIFLVMHAGETFAQRELQWLFLSGFAALLVAGPGRLSLDGLFFRNK